MRTTVDGLSEKTIYLRIRPLAVRCVPSDHERSRPLGAYAFVVALA
jgi:hypothetical protein